MRSRGSRWAAALLVGSASAATSFGALTRDARADTVAGTRSDKLVERSHTIDIRIDRGSAKLVVRRTFFNGGPRHDQAVVFVDVPSGGAATGLRTLGVKDDKPFWFSGELMEAEAAAAKYRELTGVGGYYPKDPVLLSWRSQGLLAMQVFPVAPQQPKTVEYTFEAPTTYRGGRHHLALPRMGTESLAATATVSAARAFDRVFIGDKLAAPGALVTLDKDELDIAVEPGQAETVEGALSSVVFGVGRALVGFRVEAAPRLSSAPIGAHVVVVMDASRSLRTPELTAQAAAAKAYLSNFKDAKVEVMTFDREVRAWNGGRFVGVRRAIEELNGPLPELRNGSRLDDAIARADALLRGAPPKVAKRIVVMTDFLTRKEIDPDRLKGAVKSGAIVHFGEVDAGRPELSRDDDAEWAPLARATGGVFWRAKASASEADAKEMSGVFEEWARPVRIHKAKIFVQGAAVEERQEGEVLNEGEGLSVLEVRKDPVARVEINGELWSTPYKRTFKPSDAEARLSAALVFGSPAFSDLQEKEMMGLAIFGRAVSPVTSYLAIEPGVRPSTEGLENNWGSGMGSGFGAGTGRLFSTSCAGISTFDFKGFLATKAKAAFDACGGEGKAVVDIETTRAEIVHVAIASMAAQKRASIEGCFVDALWDVMLPDAFTSAHSSFSVAVGP